jgi:hypothetical protein
LLQLGEVKTRPSNYNRNALIKVEIGISSLFPVDMVAITLFLAKRRKFHAVVGLSNFMLADKMHS